MYSVTAPGDSFMGLPVPVDPPRPHKQCYCCLVLAALSACSCGIASDAAFARVAPQFVVPGAAEKALALVLAASRE